MSLNLNPSNATFNSTMQNHLNIYSIGSDFNSPHFETDENNINIESQDAEGDEIYEGEDYDQEIINNQIEPQYSNENLINNNEFNQGKLTKINSEQGKNLKSEIQENLINKNHFFSCDGNFPTNKINIEKKNIKKILNSEFNKNIISGKNTKKLNENNNSNLNNTLSNISSTKINNQNFSTQEKENKKISISQLNTSDTSNSYKFNDVRTKIKNLQNLQGGNNRNIINTDKEKYFLTNNANDDNYSNSDSGYIYNSNKLVNKNKIINYDNNYLQNLSSSKLIKNYRNLNDLGEILDDSEEKNIQSDTKDNENNFNSGTFLFEEKFTQTSKDYSIEDNSPSEINRKKNIENFQKFTIEDITKEFISENSAKIMEMVTDDIFFKDERYKNLINNHDSIIEEKQEKFNCDEIEYKKTTKILSDFIKIQEVIKKFSQFNLKFLIF